MEDNLKIFFFQKNIYFFGGEIFFLVIFREIFLFQVLFRALLRAL